MLHAFYFPENRLCWVTQTYAIETLLIPCVSKGQATTCNHIYQLILSLWHSMNYVNGECFGPYLSGGNILNIALMLAILKTCSFLFRNPDLHPTSDRGTRPTLGNWLAQTTVWLVTKRQQNTRILPPHASSFMTHPSTPILQWDR